MFEQMPFIGRENELNKIQKWMAEWDTRRVLCIHGPGGIGKTRLLQEIKLFSSKSLANGVQKRPITVAVVSRLATSGEWYKQFATGLRSMATELGIDLIETEANYDLKRMATNLLDVIEQKPDAIIIHHGTVANLQEGLQKAVETEIPILTFDSFLEGFDGITTKVTQDDFGGARASLEQLAQDINFEGKIAAIWRENSEPLKRRRSVLDAICQKYSDLNLVADLSLVGNNVVEDTSQAIKKVLRDHPDLRAIWTTWDEFAKGATQALIEEKRRDIFVYGFDFGPQDFELMTQTNSPWVLTVAKNPIETGRTMLRLATLAALGIKTDRYYTLPLTLLTKESLPKNMTVENFDWFDLPIKQDVQIGSTTELKAMQGGIDQTEKDQTALITDIIDFDERALQLPENVEQKIARQLNERAFEPYLRGLLDSRKMEAAGVSSETLSQQREQVHQRFVNNFNEVSSNQRLVLLFDTTDKLPHEVWYDLKRLILASKNVLFLLAGRNAQALATELQTELGDEAQLVKLNSFEKEFGQQYLEQKQRLLHLNIDPNLTGKLLLLAGGKPILLDLAVEWLSRDLPSDWMSQSSLEELQALSKAQIRQYERNFELELVRHIRLIRDRMDRLTLVMSRIYPLTPAMIIKLLKISEEKAKSLFKDAQTYVFVKFLPDGKITLHDEMRRMVNEYVWPEVDPLGHRRRRDSKIAAQLFAEEDRQLKKRLREGSSSDLVGLFEREALARRREVVDQQWIEHALYSDPASGFQVWKRIINERRAANDIRFAKSLLDMAQPYDEQFNSDKKFEFDMLAARLANDIGQVREAEKMLNDLLVKNEDNLARKAEIFNALGLVEEKIGKLLDARDHQLESLNLFKKIDKDAVPLVANRVGYIHRLLGELTKADEYYNLALGSALKVDPKARNLHLIASLLNNLGYVYGLQGRYDQMDFYCHQALDIWSKIGSASDIGRAENTIAIFLRDSGEYNKAIDLLERAIRRYEQPDDHKEACRAYLELGWTQLYKAEKIDEQASDIGLLDWNKELLIQARDSIQKSRELAERYGLEAELPGILHLSALIYWYLGKVDQDESLFRKARALNTKSSLQSEQIGDIRYAISSLLADAEWDYEIGKHDNIQNYVEKLAKYQQEEYPYPLHFGRMPRIEADIAFSKGDFDTAFSKYAEGLAMIHQHGGFGRYSIERELLRLENKMSRQLDTSVFSKWVEYLRKKWAEINDRDTDLLMTWCDQQILRAQLLSLKM